VFTGIIEGVGAVEVKCLDLADFTQPEGTPVAGQSCPVLAYLVLHPSGCLLFDTGFAEDPAIDNIYHPVRRPLVDALAAFGVHPTDLTAIANCHLHFDHCGGNPLFPGVPIFMQRREYEAACEPGYTLPGLADFEGATLRLLDGEAEVLPGVTLLPTPGHTPGHQSLVVEAKSGPVVLAGQAAYNVDEYAGPRSGHVWGLKAAPDQRQYRQSLERVRNLNPQRVYLSHDDRVWQAKANALDP